MISRLIEFLSGFFHRAGLKGEDHHPGWYREPGKADDFIPEPPKPVKPKIDRFAKVRKWIKNMSYTDFLENAFYSLLLIGVAALGIFALGSIYKSAIADGKVDYCYINRLGSGEDQVFHLEGFRPWRTDRAIGEFKKFDEAMATAKKMNCKVEDRDGNVSQ